jgi:hypothetical protein
MICFYPATYYGFQPFVTQLGKLGKFSMRAFVGDGVQDFSIIYYGQQGLFK